VFLISIEKLYYEAPVSIMHHFPKKNMHTIKQAIFMPASKGNIKTKTGA